MKITQVASHKNNECAKQQ